MSKYVKINQYGYCTGPTLYKPPHETDETFVEYTGQALPCWPDGTSLTEQELADIEAQRIADSQTWQSFREGRERILVFVTGYFGTLTSVNITSDMREQLESWWIALCNAPDNCSTPQEAHALFKQGPGWWVAKQEHSSIKELVSAVLEP
jgi:hypothetical protein